MALIIRNGQKLNRLHWYCTHLHLLIWMFKQFWCPKWCWQKFCHKKSTQLDQSYLKYALGKSDPGKKSLNTYYTRLGTICIFMQEAFSTEKQFCIVDFLDQLRIRFHGNRSWFTAHDTKRVFIALLFTFILPHNFLPIFLIFTVNNKKKTKGRLWRAMFWTAEGDTS